MVAVSLLVTYRGVTIRIIGSFEMTEKDTGHSDTNPEDGEGQTEGVPEAINQWLNKDRRGRTENRAQRRWRKRNTAYEPEVEQVRAEEGTLEDIGTLLEELGEPEEEAVSNEEQNTSDTAIYFGTNDSAEIQVTVSAQGEQATVDYLSIDVDKPIPGFKEVKQVLEWNFGVVHGIDEGAINNLLEQARVDGEVKDGMVIARETPCEAGEDGRIDFLFMADDEGAEVIDGVEVSSALQADHVRGAFGLDEYPRLVAPGTALAQVVLPTPGKAGRSVTGEITAQPGAHQEPLGVGENVVEEDGAYRAQIYGYVCMIDGDLHVLSPVWIAPDQMLVAFIQYRQEVAAPPPESGWVMELLEKAGVRHGILDPAIEKLARGIEQRRGSAPVIAKGKPPVHGEDAHFDTTYDAEQRPGRVLEDGSVDFRQRNIIIGVAENDCLGEFTPETKGQDGMNVFGEVVEGRDGETLEFSAGEGVRVEDESADDGDLAGKRHFYATCDGSVQLSGDKVEVLPITNINGDVNFEVGNIETRGDVEVTGSVLYGFDIKCAGSLVVGGEIENGVNIQAGGDVAISQRIVGDNTRVVAGGSVECKLVQNATIVAQGDVMVGNSLMNAYVGSGKEVIVEAAGGKRGGSIVGGETYAAVGITAKFLGSPGYEATIVGCRPTPHQQAELDTLQSQAKSLRFEVNQSLAVMGVTALERDQIDKRLARVSKWERAAFVAAFKKAYQAADKLAEIQPQIEAKVAEQQNRLISGKIQVSETVYPEVYVEFGNKSMEIETKRAGMTYTFNGDEVKERGSESGEGGEGGEG